MEISDIGEPPFTYEALLASYEKVMSPEGFDEETMKAALAGSEEISCENGLYQLV